MVFSCRCCKMHDWCYTTTTCMILQYNLPYFVPYKWKCNGGAPYCVGGDTSGGGGCSHQVRAGQAPGQGSTSYHTCTFFQLCECDRQFVQCLADYPCPHTKAMCRSPWRYFQNLFMGLGTGMVSRISFAWLGIILRIELLSIICIRIASLHLLTLRIFSGNAISSTQLYSWSTSPC